MILVIHQRFAHNVEALTKLAPFITNPASHKAQQSEKTVRPPASRKGVGSDAKVLVTKSLQSRNSSNRVYASSNSWIMISVTEPFSSQPSQKQLNL